MTRRAPRVRLDLPLVGSSAGKGEMSRLTLTFDDAEFARSFVASFADSLRRDGAVVVIVAVNAAESAEQAFERLGPTQGESIAGGSMGIVTVSRARQILALWKAEQHVLFVTGKEQVEGLLASVEQRRPKWWQFSTLRDELSFLTVIDTPLLIYSDPRASIEIYSRDDSLLMGIAAKSRAVEFPELPGAVL